jgi:transaldolase
MEELMLADGEVERLLDPEEARDMDLDRLNLDEQAFRWALNQDSMATEKLAEGIRKFVADADKLQALISA